MPEIEILCSFEGYTCLFFVPQLLKILFTHCKYRTKFKIKQRFVEQISMPVWKEE